MLRQARLQQETFRVKFLSGSGNGFGILLKSRQIPIFGAYAGDLVKVPNERCALKTLESPLAIEKYLLRVSRLRNGTVASKCPYSGVRCNRCPWREMSAEAQIRSKIKIAGDLLFDDIKIRRDQITRNFEISSADPINTYEVDSHHASMTLYFGTGQNLNCRSIGTIYQCTPNAYPFVYSIHGKCRLMAPEIRETVAAINDWWAQHRKKPGWDSGNEHALSKFLSLTVHYLTSMNDILVRFQVIGKGPKEYLLCSNSSLSLLSEAEDTITNIIKQRLFSQGYSGKVHISILIRNPVSNERHCKILLGNDKVFDRLHVCGIDIFVPICMIGTHIAYDRQPNRHRLLCRELHKSVNAHAPKTILFVDQREKLDCSILSIVLLISKGICSLNRVYFPVVATRTSSAKDSALAMYESEKAVFEAALRMNGIPSEMIHDRISSEPVDISIVCFTADFFRTCTGEKPHPLFRKLQESRIVYLIYRDLVENLETRRGLDLLLQAGFRLFRVKNVSDFHSNIVGGFIELLKI